jgi:Fe-S cluster assembly protein SufD
MPLDNRSIALPYVDRFADVAAQLPGQQLPWLRDLRAEAIERVRQLGLPTVRVERWKYTNLNALGAVAFTPAGPAETLIATDRLPSIAGGYRFVIVDGRFRPELSASQPPAGLTVASVASLLRDDPESVRPLFADQGSRDDSMDALNLAFATDGYVVHVAAGARIEAPVEVLQLRTGGATATAAHIRNRVLAEPGSSVTIVERFLGDAAATYWTQAACDVHVEQGATVRRYKDQQEGTKAFHIAADRVRVARDARYESFVLATGAALSRNEITVILDGPGASCQIDGGYLARGRQHVDNTTEIRHAKPHTTSSEVYKGVLDDQARGVFQGRIVVEKDAQKADGHQLSKTILLSDRAEIDTKPELEIFADDVKCSHGATAGELDDDALFYLRARGIDPAEARRLLVEAFINDALVNVTDTAIRTAFEQRIGGWMTRSNGERAA